MEAIYPITALQKNNAVIKEEARERVVHVTENGRAAFVFMSEEVLDDLIACEREQAVWEAQFFASIDRGMRDIEEGRYHEGWDALEAHLEQIKAKRRQEQEANVSATGPSGNEREGAIGDAKVA